MSADLLAKRITEYLSGGGLFNPELANHEAVRDLLIECRDAFKAHPSGDEWVMPEPAGVAEIDCGPAPGGGRELMYVDGFTAAQLRSAYEAGLAARIPAGWQPIETAPRDGTPILVSWPIRELDDDEVPSGPIVRRKTLVTEMIGDYWLEPEVCNASGEWFGDDYAYAVDPDLWQPIPAPPITATEAPATAKGGE